RHGSAQVIFEDYPVRGYNYRMTDIQAAVGREQLKRLPGIIARRRALAQRYHGLLGQCLDSAPPAEPAWARSNWQSYPLRLACGVDQRGVMQEMLEAGIATRRGIMSIHMEASHTDAPLRQPLSRSEAARDHVILLPLYAQMTEAEQDQVIAALARALAHNRPAERYVTVA
ncbi:DegT/DnrJ/EryC1/StrS aminotransferase family protein, partial [Thioclava sp. BHET1]